jgi:hypothetical protein
MAYVDLNPVRAGLAQSLEESDFTAVQQRLADYAQANARSNSRCKPQPELPSKALGQCLTERINKQQKLAADLDATDWPRAPLMHLEAVAASRQQSEDPWSRNDDSAAPSLSYIPFTLESYLQLVQETGILCLPDKKGCLSKASNAVLSDLGLDANYWLEHVIGFEHYYGVCVGGADRLFSRARSRDRAWVKGVGAVGRLYR